MWSWTALSKKKGNVLIGKENYFTGSKNIHKYWAEGDLASSMIHYVETGQFDRIIGVSKEILEIVNNMYAPTTPEMCKEWVLVLNNLEDMNTKRKALIKESEAICEIVKRTLQSPNYNCRTELDDYVKELHEENESLSLNYVSVLSIIGALVIRNLLFLAEVLNECKVLIKIKWTNKIYQSFGLFNKSFPNIRLEFKLVVDSLESGIGNVPVSDVNRVFSKIYYRRG